MPVTPAQDVHIEIVMVGLAASKGSNAVNTAAVFHFRRVATVIDPLKVPIDTAFQAAIGDVVCAALNESWTQEHNTLRWLDDPLDAPLLVTHAVPGAITGDRLPPQNAAYLEFKTAFKGRSYRGSKHLSPMSESDSTAATGDLFNAGALTRLSAIATAIMTGFTDSTGNVWVPQVVSKKLSDFSLSPSTVAGFDLTQVLVNKRIGRMKRRQVKSVY